MKIAVKIGGARLNAWSLNAEAEPDSYILRMRDGSAPLDCQGWEVEGPGIPPDTTVVDVAPDGSSIIMLNPWKPVDASAVLDRPKAWVGDDDIRPVGLALRELIAKKRLLGQLPDDVTLTVVMTIRPDNHGRVVAFPLDLLAAGDDRWVDDVLTSSPITQVRWTP